MAGVFSTQQPDMEDECMQDASMLSIDHGGSRPESALASPGDPMDISPLPATNQHNQHVGEQHPTETSSQAVVQNLGQPSGSPRPREPSAGDQRSLSFGASGHVDPASSMGFQTRSAVFSSSFRFSPKDRPAAKKNQLKRIPLAVQAKLPTPVRPSYRNFRSLASNPHFQPSNQLHTNNFAVNRPSSLASSTSFNRLNGHQSQSFLPVNRQLFKPAAQPSASTNFMTAAHNASPISRAPVEPSAKSISETPAFTDATETGGEETSHGGSSLQRKRLMDEEESNDIGIRRPTPFVSPSYRRISQPGSNSAPSSPAQHTQQETSVQSSGLLNSPVRLTVTPPTSSTLISPSRPNNSAAETRLADRADNPEHLNVWNDMRELDQVFRDQGIAPLQEKSPVETWTHLDPIKEPPKDFDYRMPGSWPEDPLDFSEPIEEESLPAQDPALFGDHGWLMSDALDASPRLVPTAQQPVDPTPSQEPNISPSSSQGFEASQMQDTEFAQEHLKDSSSQLSMSWYDQLHRIYNHSWEATHCIVTTAIALAGSVKRRAVALFEERPVARRPTSHTATTSTSPTRANVRALPEEQRRRLKSYQWRRDRGFPTVHTYPFPQLSLDTSPPPSPAARLSQVKHSPKPVKPVTPVAKKSKNIKRLKHGAISAKDAKRQSAKAGVHKRPLVQSLSPNMTRRMRVRSTQRKFAGARLDHSLLHAVQHGKLALNELPMKQQKFVAAEQDKKLAPTQPMETQQAPLLKPILRKPSTEAARPKRTAPRKVRFVLDSIPKDDPSLVGHYLHPDLPQQIDEIAEPSAAEEEENEPSKPTAVQHYEELDPDLRSWLQSDFPFGRPVSAVRLFVPGRQPLPPGRTESIFAAEWRKIEEEEKSKETPARIRPKGPAVRRLPANWETRLAEVTSLPNNRQVATTLSGDPLTKRDVATCYTPMAWLNDEIINSYLALLVDYLRRAHGNAGRHDKPKFHAFNSFFFSNLRDKGYASVRRWAQRAKIGGGSLLDVDTVFIPVHDSAHWTLMVVRPTSRSIEHFDSLGSPSARHVAKVKEWLRGELSAHYVDEEWSVAPSVSPQQDNGSDCGAFLLSTAKAVAIGIEPQSYGAKDIPLLRRKIVAELMAGGLGGDFEPAGEMGEILM